MAAKKPKEVEKETVFIKRSGPKKCLTTFFLVFLTASEQKYKEDQITIPPTVYSIRAHLYKHMNERVGRRMKMSFVFPSLVFFN